MNARQYKNYKGLKKEKLRDNMSVLELALNMPVEVTTELTKVHNPQGLEKNGIVVKSGGQIAGKIRGRIEKENKTIADAGEGCWYLWKEISAWKKKLY